MSYDRNSDAEETSAWPGTQPPFSAPVPPAVPQTGAQAQPWQQPTAQPSPSGWVPPPRRGRRRAPHSPATVSRKHPKCPPRQPNPAAPKGHPRRGGRCRCPGCRWRRVLLLDTHLRQTAWAVLHHQLGHLQRHNHEPATTEHHRHQQRTAPSAAAPGPGAAATPAPSAPPKAAAPVDPADLQSYLATADALSTRFGAPTCSPWAWANSP